MKKFIGWILLLLVILFGIDRLSSILMGELYLSSKATNEYKINYVINKMNQPVVFMGSSRCHHTYVPSIISDTLGLPVYNAGLWGEQNIYFQYGLLCDFLSRYTPKVICYEIHPIDFMATPYSGIERISSLSPFIGRSKECDNLFKLNHSYIEYKISHLYRYNSTLISLIGGCLFSENSQKDNGYKPLFREVDASAKPDEFNFPLDCQRIKVLTDFVNICKSRHIKLIFLCAPMYKVSSSCIDAYKFVSIFSQQHHIIFINNLQDKRFVGMRNLCYDRGHFNDKGARIYSSVIANELKRFIY